MNKLPADWTPQPTARMCFVCGRENPVGLRLHFYEDLEKEQVIAPVIIPDTYQGYPGITHGGIVAAILDETSGRAIMINAESTPFWVTAKLELHYHKPTPTETPLTAVGWVVKRRRRVAEVAGEIRTADGEVTASVKAIMVYPHEETLKDWKQEQQFWQVQE
ncbi:MAG: PaaI family thioesterase [Anaerolineae bacterium]|nr:PaaI family thioesterase [Anaerolineae bacterium]